MEIIEIFFISVLISIVTISYLLYKVVKLDKLCQFKDKQLKDKTQLIDALELNVRNRDDIIQRRMV